MNEISVNEDCSSDGVPNTSGRLPTPQVNELNMIQINNIVANKTKCPSELNERITLGCNEIHSNESTDASNLNKRKTKFCRPNADDLLCNIKQSLLWSNLSQIDNNYQEKIWNMSQNLFDGTLIDWSKRVWEDHCFSNNTTENEHASQLTRKQSDENIVCSNETDATCKTESPTNILRSDETMQHLTDCLQNVFTINGKFPKNSKSKHPIEHVDIIIVGAGLAGIGAATTISEFQKNGTKCSYLILEAQHGPGGRVKTNKLLKFSQKNPNINENSTEKSIYIDSGAQWLHGRNNFLYTVAEKNHLLLPDQSQEGLGLFFYENSTQIDTDLVEKVDFHFGQLLQKCEEFARQTTNNDYPKSVGHFLRENFQQFVESLENQQEKQIAKDLFDWHERFQIIDNSCLSLDSLSAKYWGKYSFNGESCQAHYNFKDGFGSVVDHLVNELNNDSVLYNKEVIEIHIHDNRTEINNNDRSNDRKMPVISVKCSDGSRFTANHILITISLGILKKVHKSMFSPSLPRSIQTAIESIGFETINKIFFEFDTPWWGELNGIQFVFNHNEKKTKWTHYLTGFDVLKPSYPNMLLGWVGGIGAIQMEALTDNQIISDCMELLTKFTNSKVPYPTRYYCTRWQSNPYVNGAYSYISTKCDHNETVSQNLLCQALKIGDFYVAEKKCDAEITTAISGRQSKSHINLLPNLPVVLFAGEACHDKYFSTAHGAFLSGMEQMNKILKIYDEEKPKVLSTD